MKQQVDITMKLSLWLNAAMSKEDIVTHVRSALPDAFGEQLTAMKNPVDIIDVKQEAEIYGTNVPPDPEGMNDRRAAWAGQALRAFREETGTDEEDALPDLLGDLMHWCDRHNYDFDIALDRARWHYGAETGDGNS